MNYVTDSKSTSSILRSCFVWNSGDKYVGNFKNGYIDGRGTISFHDGVLCCRVVEQHISTLPPRLNVPFSFEIKEPSITVSGSLISFMVKELEDLKMATSITEIMPMENGKVKVRSADLYCVDSILRMARLKL